MRAIRPSSPWRRLPEPARITGYLAERYRRTAFGNLAVLDWNGDFLAPFLARRGEGGGYVGLGKTLEALSRMAACLGSRPLHALRRRAMDALAGAQLTSGYLGTYRPSARVEKRWDVHELSYLLFALVVDFRLFGEVRSLDMARRLGRYLIRELAHAALWRDPVHLELTTLGLDRALIALHRATGEPACLDFLLRRMRLRAWNPDIVTGRHGAISGHAYAYLVRALAQLELAEVTGDPRLPDTCSKVRRHLFDEDGLLISGTCGVQECWDSQQTVAGDVGETCATAYLIRWAEMRLRMDGHGRYADLMERAIYNALFAAQSPDGRQLRYYVPLLGPRTYWPRDTYCCPGNFRRIVAELPELVYHGRPDALRINLYEDSRVRVRMGDGVPVELVMQTRYPADGRVVIHVNPARPVVFSLQARMPGWCRKSEFRLNGTERRPVCRQGYIRIRREWHAGDGVELRFDMPWRLVAGRRLQAGRAAAMLGPRVFGADPARSPAFSAADFTRVTLRPPAGDAAPVSGDMIRLPAEQVDPHTGRMRRGPLRLTPFSDPNVQVTYFPVGADVPPVRDELHNK